MKGGRKEMYVLLNWSGMSFDNVALVTDEDGSAMLFDTLAETCAYARDCLNFSWCPCELQ